MASRMPTTTAPTAMQYARNRFGPNGDLDRDGIRNRDDRDRDGDGVRNRRDNYPERPQAALIASDAKARHAPGFFVPAAQQEAQPYAHCRRMLTRPAAMQSLCSLP